jgi:hypothetical protein
MNRQHRNNSAQIGDILSKYRKRGINVLSNHDFSSPIGTGWDQSGGVVRSTFPDDQTNPCALMTLFYGSETFLRQHLSEMQVSAQYLVAFRYVFQGEKVDQVVVRVSLERASSEVILSRSIGNTAAYCFLFLDAPSADTYFDVLPYGFADEVASGALYLDDMILAKCEPPPESLLRNGGFEEKEKYWTLEQAAVRLINPVKPESGHHLVLAAAVERDSIAEQLLHLPKAGAGTYLLTFNIIRSLGDLTPPEPGEVSLLGKGGGQTLGFAFGAVGVVTMTFLFTLSADEIAPDVTLRIAKLKFQPSIDTWFVDDVRLFPL